MKIIFQVYPIHTPLTGIGRYAWELASRLPCLQEIEEIKYFGLGNWVSNLERLLDPACTSASFRSLLTRSKMAVGLYQKLSPLLYNKRLSGYEEYLFHSPNFILPSFSGKSIATFHDMSIYRCPEFHRPSQIALMKREIPKALDRADHIIAVSKFTKQEIIDISGYPEQKISVVYNGVSSKFYPRNKAELQQKLQKYQLEPKRYFLSLATIEPRKNIDTILDAYQQLPNGIRSHYPLVIGGPPGWKSQAIHERIQFLIGKGQVRYLGYVPECDLPILYAGATAKIFIPFYEGFGLPALEALASGTPVISSNNSSLPEIVGGMKYGVSPLDVKDVALKMESIIDKSSNMALRDVANNPIRTGFTWQRCAEQTLCVYAECVARN